MSIFNDYIAKPLSDVASALGTFGESAADLITNPGESQGSASGTDLAQEKYDFKYRVFPSDLGRSDVGHYMVININVPTKGIKTSGLDLREAAGNYEVFRGRRLFSPINNVSKVDVLRYGDGQNITNNRPLVSIIPRQTRRIAESIALHMPNPLVFSDQNVYQEVSLTALAGDVAAGIGSFGLEALRKAGNDLAKIVEAPVFDGLGNAVDVGSKLMSNPINPAIEVLFSNKLQRQFAFELLLAPRNEKESITIKEIIKTLRFHASPEINTSLAGLGGLTWIPPAEFDITFFNKGVENFHIQRMNTCVLERIEVDYAPTGVYSTFRNGHPVAVRVGLAMRELEPIHKQRVLQNF